MSETTEQTQCGRRCCGAPIGFWIGVAAVAVAAAMSPRVFDRIWSRHH
ncbi:hypothetical protein [Acidipropionibacterium acidipropionici]|nr:hypothetical protein [Acidipropionibacterium acidipropionici]